MTMTTTMKRTVIELTRDGSVSFRREQQVNPNAFQSAIIPVLAIARWVRIPQFNRIAKTANLLLPFITPHLRDAQPGDVPLPFCPLCYDEVCWLVNSSDDDCAGVPDFFVRPAFLIEYEDKALEAILEASPTGRVNYEFRAALQNIPLRTQLGREIRDHLLKEFFSGEAEGL